MAVKAVNDTASLDGLVTERVKRKGDKENGISKLVNRRIVYLRPIRKLYSLLYNYKQDL